MCPARPSPWLLAACAGAGLVLALASPPSRASVSERLEGLRAAGATEAYLTRVEALEAERQRLAGLFQLARGAAARRAVLAEARQVLEARVPDLFPDWYGTPWFMGEDDDALVPHQPGKRVSCSAFVTAVLLSAGFRLDSRTRWMQAPALQIQRSLRPPPARLHRFLSLPPADLARRLARLPEGLYVVGLNCHVGFVRIRAGEVRFIHSDYTEPERGVRDEPVGTSEAMANSQAVGYWLSPALADEGTLVRWLEGTPLPLRPLGEARAELRRPPEPG